MNHDAHAAHGGRAHVPHVLPLHVYIGVWAALIVLTAITVAVSYFDFGEGNIIVAMAVATIKASLVCAFFMHLKYDDRFNTMVLVGAFAFLGLLFMFSLADLPMRGEVDPAEKGTIQVLPESSIPGGEGHATEGDHGAEAAPAAGEQGTEAAPAEGAPADSGTAPAGEPSGGH